MSKEEKVYEFEKLPRTCEEFLVERDKIAKEAGGGAAIFVIAFIIWQRDENFGEQLFTIALDREYVEKNSSNKNNYKGYVVKARTLKDMKFRCSTDYISRSYIYGNNNPDPKNQYSFDPEKSFKIITYRQRVDEERNGIQKIFVCCTGARARPISLKKNNKGIFKAENFGSLQVGVQYTKPVVDDDL